MPKKVFAILACLTAAILLISFAAWADEDRGPKPTVEDGWVKYVKIYVKTPDGSKVDGTWVIQTKEIGKSYNGKIKRNQGGKYIICANSAHYEFNHTVTVDTKFGKASKSFRTFQGHCDNDMAVTVKY